MFYIARERESQKEYQIGVESLDLMEKGTMKMHAGLGLGLQKPGMRDLEASNK